MIALLLLTAALVALCCVLGQGVLAACGWSSWRWWAPTLGYGVLLIVFGQFIRIPNHQTLVIAIVLVAAVAALAFGGVRRALAEAWLDAVGLGVLVLLAAAVPFFASGHAGVLGPTLSDDMSHHLLGAFYLRTHDSMLPAAAIGGDLITDGYPMGPHGLAAALTRATGAGEATAFSAITLAVPILTAFAALSVVPDARRGARWALGLLVGLGYLPAAYLAQGSFKETGQALLVLAGAVALRDLASPRPSRGFRRGAPIGLLIGAAVYNYSYGGAAWIVATALLFGAAELVRRRHAFLPTVRNAAAPVLSALVVAVVVLVPELHRIQKFKKSIFGAEPLTNHGNLFHALNPLETLGVWFSGDFRFNPQPEWLSFAASAVALGVLLGGLVWWLRRRDFALPAALVAAVAVWIDLALTRNIYNAAKGLVVLAPVLAVCAGAPLLAAWSVRPRARASRLPLNALRVLGVLLLIGAAIATAGILRSAPVGLGPHADELEAMRPLIKTDPTLYLTSDHFAQWELRGAHLYVTGPLYAPAHLGQHPQKMGGSPVDADNYGSHDLDKVRYIVTPAGSYQSEIPPNFKLVRQTASFQLFRRQPATPVREPIEPPSQPGTVFNCRSARGRQYLASFKRAGVLPRPVVRDQWAGSIAQPGRTAAVTVTLPRGRWDVSLQYVSHTGLVVRAPGLQRRLAPNYGVLTAYWPAGTLTSSGRPLTLAVTAQERSWFGKLIGAPRPTRAALSPGNAPIWHVAFTRHGARPRRVPVRSACGRYVDWFAPAGSTMKARSGDVG